jgi:acyl-coenzyme A thioesterase PaaI-like protein
MFASTSRLCFPLTALSVASVQLFRSQRKSECASPTVSPYSPDLNEYVAIDEQDSKSDYHILRSKHVLYSSLIDESRIKSYKAYRHKEREEIYCIVEFGHKINGWPGIVHGGISALLLDNTFGWLLFAFQKSAAVTANLNINYRSPVYANSTSIVQVKIDKTEGRKLFMSGSIFEANTKRVQVEATSLFITVGKEK